MQWVLNMCGTLKIPRWESCQKFKITFLKIFSPVKSWSYGRLGWENPKRSGILLFPDLPRFGRLMKTRTRRHSQSSWMIGFPDAFEISAMVGDHSRHMKTQIYSVEDVGYRLAIVFWTVPISKLLGSSLSSYKSMASGINSKFFLTYPRGGEIWLIGKQRNPWSSGRLFLLGFSVHITIRLKF